MQEPYLDEHNSLISDEAWRSLIERLERSSISNDEGNSDESDEIDGRDERGDDESFGEISGKSFADSKERLLFELEQKITDSIQRRIPSNKNEKVAVLFSGGVDSVLIAFLLKKLGVEPLCITVGFQEPNAKEPEDIVESERFAKELNLEHISILLNLEQMNKLFKRTVHVLGHELTTVVNVGVSSVEIAAIEEGKKHNISFFFGGLGAEELFAGYDRHEQAWKKNNSVLKDECVAGLKRVLTNDLQRDCAVAEAFDVTLATPFLDEGLIELSLRIPPELKINSDSIFIGRAQGDIPVRRPIKKLILREAALALGLPKKMAFRPKRAAQYGSRTNNALTMLTARGNYRYKNRYLESLLHTLTES